VDRVDPAVSSLRLREVPLLRETEVPAKQLRQAGIVDWNRNPDDWFDLGWTNSFRMRSQAVAVPRGEQAWELPAAGDSRRGWFLTFEFSEEITGWPYFTIEAPEGTIVEAMCLEAYDPSGPPKFLAAPFWAWSRFTCREGTNHFQTFDIEALRWLQLHVRNPNGPAIIRQVGVRRRLFDWASQPRVACAEPALQRLFDANLNTICNSTWEICSGDACRERQQYSGDGAHQLHVIREVFGEPRATQRFLRTFSEGISKEGYFMDCWPAVDRRFRVMQREIDAAYWGPLLDHGVGFNFDCWNHYWETGDLAALDEPYPRLLRFADYLDSIRDKDGLLPVENLGVPAVWIDHLGFKQQRHRQCAFNLYAAAMLEHALAPIAHARGDHQRAEEFTRRGRALLAQAIKRFWDPQRGLFVDNLPWLGEEKGPRLHDRALSTALLFDQCPGGNTAASLRALVECPREMGQSYPCNACWRYWALARLGRADVVLDDLRKRWATMDSVILNNTLQEGWKMSLNSAGDWSHCPAAPLDLLFRDIAGIRATAPGFAQCQIRPQLSDLGDLELTYHTPRGAILFAAKKQPRGHRVSVAIPAGCQTELLLPEAQSVSLPPLVPDHPLDLKRLQLESGKENIFVVEP
jgi:hypothetical protein